MEQMKSVAMSAHFACPCRSPTGSHATRASSFFAVAFSSRPFDVAAVSPPLVDCRGDRVCRAPRRKASETSPADIRLGASCGTARAKKSAPRTEVAAARRAGEETGAVSVRIRVCWGAGLPLGAPCRRHATLHRLTCRLRDHTSGSFGAHATNLSPDAAVQPLLRFAVRESVASAPRPAPAGDVGIRPTRRRAAIRQGLWKAPDSWEFGASTQWPHFAAQFG